MTSSPFIFPNPSAVCQGFPNINVYELQLTLTGAGQETKPIIIPADVQEIVVSLFPRDGAEATVFTTTDIYPEVIKDSPDIDWFEWAMGRVMYPAQDYCPKVTAIKISQHTAGSVKISMRMQ